MHHPHFFTFVYEEGVEPTNNVAERALRTAVQWRKIMFGNRSAAGELAVARLLTVTRTCQLQQLSVLAYLVTAIRCHRRRQAVAAERGPERGDEGEAEPEHAGQCEQNPTRRSR